ncbi:rhodanese-like domain-containing protein [Methanolapillus millepedarum]|uniref:Sulfurtransferase n=1 Tax=Methanolapillus millepedarum TaxID=3028296 RepID=A0AA96V2M2_9EURY|nr:Sulfurtransferase [Methanosarcinaceae archaeon Ac7]
MSVKVLPPIEIQKWMTEKSVSLVDVRTPQERASGYIQNSVSINVNAPDFEPKLNALDKSKPVIFYCQSGVRAGRAAATAEKLGFPEIYSIEGGFNGWNSKRLPIVY